MSFQNIESELQILEERKNLNIRSIDFQKDFNDQFFIDGKRYIDYILVYNTDDRDIRRTIFLKSLEEIEMELEEVPSLLNSEINYIKVHTPKHILNSHADKYDIPLKKFQTNYIRPIKPKFAFLRNELTSQNPNSPNYDRASETFSGNQPTKALRNERSLITYSILRRIIYGSDPTVDIGIQNLVAQEVFIAAFPLHDGTSVWNDNHNNPLNDRQLLRKYWSSPRNFFKAQPLDVIERYFGDNIALYYAWLSFYNQMLLMGPLFIGVILTIVNYFTYYEDSVYVKETCKSNVILCPEYPSGSVKLLKEYCAMHKISAVTDNFLTNIFATFMTFWAAIYLVLWKRKQAVLAVRWNIQDSSLELQDVRPEFENFVTHVRTSEIGEPEYYIPWFSVLWRKTVAWSACLFIISILIFTILGLIVNEVTVNHTINIQMLPTILCAYINTFQIVILRRVCIMFYEPIVKMLVYLEMPQTETDYENSYIIKVCCFSFINNYGTTIYTAFFKGKFFTHPNDPFIYKSVFPIWGDYCGSYGCSAEAHFTILCYVILIPYINHILNFIYTRITVWYRKRTENKNKIPYELIPRWEKDYELNDFQNTDLLSQYEDMVIQFGYITIFAFALPCGSLVAFISNMIKIHIDAHNLVVHYRRPQAKRIASVGAWLDVMAFIVYLSIFTNATYITFTSNIIPKYYYKYFQDSSLKGFVNFTLSSYVLNIDHWPNANVPNGTTCYYPGFRNPPDHKMPYEYSYEHYALLSIKFGFIVFFEHFVLIVTALVSYAIPSIPSVIKEQHAVQTMYLRKHLEINPGPSYSIN